MPPNENPTGDQTPPAAPTNDDSAEWDEAGIDFLSDKGVEAPSTAKEQETIEEQDDPQPKDDPVQEDGGKDDTEPTDPKTTEKGNVQTGEEGKPKDGSETPEGEQPPAEQPTPTPEQQEAQRRQTQLALEADRKDLAKDIREKMFSDVPTRLEDADGDPIETIQDVMQLRNPNTGQRFTAEEAAQYLLQAQRHFDKQQEETRSKVDDIVEVNLNIKEQAEAVKSEYGEILAHMPKLRARLWNQFKATLDTDESGEVFTRMPLSMKEFYDTAMAPYVKQVEDMKANAQAEADKKAKEEAEAKKKEAEKNKRQSQSDREDVFSTRTKIEEGMDTEEREWAMAAKEHYEG